MSDQPGYSNYPLSPPSRPISPLWCRPTTPDIRDSDDAEELRHYKRAAEDWHRFYDMLKITFPDEQQYIVERQACDAGMLGNLEEREDRSVKSEEVLGDQPKDEEPEGSLVRSESPRARAGRLQTYIPRGFRGKKGVSAPTPPEVREPSPHRIENAKTHAEIVWFQTISTAWKEYYEARIEWLHPPTRSDKERYDEEMRRCRGRIVAQHAMQHICILRDEELARMQRERVPAPAPSWR
ncbi:hypothetical protein K461DRAFT_298058 [Myriangium duriaei CBS 260.36]|uniref:Uncharacterized protein n=1 Tax=Myriangium duriaei CBS 260.36 TaxID=1168546 RepID=A0A9P4IQQ2_9PEZI|nr:hypothetical protein K461DRAFT_298058 [Myriangium duriaei CBS 260.36]